ncbi:hypothetical protein [Ectothiorhodospira variabilis]|uniref:hypothetical protein n=1 Tax=Ectothiorhodospira variabilis TaxID=505694 RepID=UPI001EFBCB5D|nr:hypothetical protein [Ectothiorhodospira variabilis]MCG5496597.1 hypothetical protein [Ectothiorhodospira variabilis]
MAPQDPADLGQGPTIESRMERRFIVMSTRDALLQSLEPLTPAGWTQVTVTDLDDIGPWNELLLHRFMVLDLDDPEAFDPLDVIQTLRMQYQINLPVFCVGGDADLQGDMRLARADRFFTEAELQEMLPRFFELYGWGG